MGEKHTFRAVIEDAGSGGAYVIIPFDVEQAFGKKRVKVKALIEGEFYQGSLVRMGGSEHILGIRKDIREKIGRSIGDEVEISVEEDLEPREVDLPEDLKRALENDTQALAAFLRLSYTHQKEYVQWIEEAKRDATRQSRVERALGLIKNGKKGRK
jgi:hypothetical protein